MPIVQLLHRKIKGGKFAIPPGYDGEIPPGIGLEGSFRQEPQNELGVNEQQGRRKQFLLTTNSRQQCVQVEG